MRPMRALWLSVPDLVEAERSLKPGRPSVELNDYPPCSYMTAHKRVERMRGSAKDKDCEVCGEAAHHWSYKGNSPREQTGIHSAARQEVIAWSPDPRDYRPLCSSCHRVFDGLLRMPKEIAERILREAVRGVP